MQPKKKRGPVKKKGSATAQMIFRVSPEDKAAFIAKHGKGYSKILREFVKRNL